MRPSRLGNTPQHRVLFGTTGAGKSVIIADLLAQIGHEFGFRLIVEEGLSHAVLTETQGCEPVIVNPGVVLAGDLRHWRHLPPKAYDASYATFQDAFLPRDQEQFRGVGSTRR